MSTDIIRFQNDQNGEPQRVFHSKALQLYLMITLPLMLLTFAAWYFVKRRIGRKTRQNTDEEMSSGITDVK